MLSRSLAILVAPWLPAAALILPLGPAHAANALVAGMLALVLSAFSLTYDRARVSVALIGVWVALTAFIFQSTLLEEVVAVSWGVSMFTLMVGPFSDPFQVTRTRTLVLAVAPAASRAPAVAAVDLGRAA
jgi:hypothetical protein